MRFNRRARLDTSRVRDRRGMGRVMGRVGGHGGMRRGGVAAGGLGTLLLVVVALLAGIDPGAIMGLDSGGGPAPQTGAGPGASAGSLAQCRTGADVQRDADCRYVVIENSVQAFWDAEFSERGARYVPATFTAFSGQADCLAGVWANGATATGPDGTEPLITEITPADIAEGIDAAETVGDDYIQERFGGSVTPETWTHGSSDQRRRWFELGLAEGELETCDTFAATEL